MRDLRKVGEDAYIYRLEYSKTQQAGVSVDSTPDKPILGRSAEALAAWLNEAKIHEGAIFRRVWKGRVGPALLPGSVAAIVKRRAKLAGLEGDFGAHSLRSGFVTEAGKQGVPLPAVMAMTEHRSVASVIGYFQAGAAEDHPAARLLKYLRTHGMGRSKGRFRRVRMQVSDRGGRSRDLAVPSILGIFRIYDGKSI